MTMNTRPAITPLRCRSSSDIDLPLLLSLGDRLGPQAATEVVCDRLEQIALLLCDIAAVATAPPYGPVAERAQRLSALAAEIGLRELAQIARHVADCAGRADSIALAATRARLERCFEAVVTSIWDSWPV